MKWLRRTFLFSLASSSILTLFGYKAEPSMEQRMHRKLQKLIDSGSEKKKRLTENFLDVLLTIRGKEAQNETED